VDLHCGHRAGRSPGRQCRRLDGEGRHLSLRAEARDAKWAEKAAVVNARNDRLAAVPTTLALELDAVKVNMTAQLASHHLLRPAGAVSAPAGVPAFADGGIVTRPTLALVGEDGSELIVPLTSTMPAAGST
jgi:hypothetical protein